MVRCSTKFCDTMPNFTSAALTATSARLHRHDCFCRSTPRTAEQYTAAKRLTPRGCIHCHNVYDFRREELQTSGKWRLDELWVYPLPENVGLTAEADRGNRNGRDLILECREILQANSPLPAQYA